MKNRLRSSGFTMAELLMSMTIAIMVMGGAFAIWFMTQNSWVNERKKSTALQDIQIAIERIKREIQLSDSSKIFYHTNDDGYYDAISFPMALDDGKSNTGYNPLQNNDGFLETDSTTSDPTTGVSKIYWDKTVIYHIYPESGTDADGLKQLKRTIFMRDKSLISDQFQQQINKVVELGTGNDPTVTSYANWETTRTLFKANDVSFAMTPKLLEFDGYSSQTERTEDLIDFGSAILDGGYHTLKFKVTRQNPDATGFAFGIDLLKFTPPGSTMEGENYSSLTHPDGSSGIEGSSGDAITKVKMHETSQYGVWSNDYYLNYAANAINDYLTLRFYYDEWYDTTFVDGVAGNTIVEFGNRSGKKKETSGDEEYILRLEGYDTTWNTYEQMRLSGPNYTDSAVDSNNTYRIILSGAFARCSGMKLRINFKAPSSGNFTIQSAYITQRASSGTGVDPYDGSDDMDYKQVFFDYGGDPNSPNITITAGDTESSNWIQLENADHSESMPFDKANDYLITFYVSGSTDIAYWESSNPSIDLMSYKNGDILAPTQIDWPPDLPGERRIYAVESVEVTYMNTGSFVSKVFDTAMDNPSYTKMIWTSVINPDATLTMKVRSADTKEELESDADWQDNSGIIAASSPATISGISGGRYVQYRADFTAIAGGATSDDYDQTCILKDVAIYWPGETRMVDIGGYFTKKPDYGIFTVEVDGKKLTKGLDINLSINSQSTAGSDITRSVTAEIEPRNTNK